MSAKKSDLFDALQANSTIKQSLEDNIGLLQAGYSTKNPLTFTADRNMDLPVLAFWLIYDPDVASQLLSSRDKAKLLEIIGTAKTALVELTKRSQASKKLVSEVINNAGALVEQYHINGLDDSDEDDEDPGEDVPINPDVVF